MSDDGEPSSPDELPDLYTRMTELERRVTAIESGSARGPRRTPKDKRIAELVVEGDRLRRCVVDLRKVRASLREQNQTSAQRAFVLARQLDEMTADRDETVRQLRTATTANEALKKELATMKAIDALCDIAQTT